MRQEPERNSADGRLRRAAWFLVLWLGGVATVAALAYLLRYLLRLG